MGQLWLELWYEPVKPGSCWVVVAASTVLVNGGVQWELIRDVVVQVIWPVRGLPAVPAAPWQPPQPKCACSSSLKLMTPVAMETVSVKIYRFFIPTCRILTYSWKLSKFACSYKTATPPVCLEQVRRLGLTCGFHVVMKKHLGTLSKEEMTVVFEQLGALSLLMKFLLCAVGTRVKTKRMLCCCNSCSMPQSMWRGIKGSNYMFKKLDGNKDGKVQVHEFIAWLFQKDPKCSLSDDVTDGNGAWTMYP